jgi:hypothetical protein
MAIKVNSKEIETVMCPAVNGARAEAQAVRIHNGTSWIDVWSNIKIMTMLSNSITKGFSLISNKNRKIQFYKYMDGANNGTLLGGGTIVFYLDGLWTDPYIYFSWVGSYMYQVTNGTWYVSSGGQISLYYRKKGSTTATTEIVVNRVGEPQTGVDSPEDAYGEVEKTLSGTYDQLGLSIKVHGYSGTKYSACIWVCVEEVMFGDQKIGFPNEAIFDYS